MMAINQPFLVIKAGALLFSISLMKYTAVLLEEEPEHAGSRQPVCQYGGLVMRPRRPQPVQQPGHGVPAVEGDMGGRIAAQQHSDLVVARRLQPVQQGGHGEVEPMSYGPYSNDS
jgi:hypothetical protein